jgi:hypothetical protein
MDQPFEPSGIRLGIARGISYGLFGPPEQIIEPIRELGAGLVRIYFYWNQVEPNPGVFDWSVVDAFLSQLGGDEEVWVTVCSSSLWATRQPSDFLPPSPAKDDDAYYGFVHALVSHCGGRVQYWQCNNEPSNIGLLWAGTAADYVAQLAVFRRAVRDADPSAAVLLGGCGYDVLSSPPDGPARQFFDHVVAEGGDLYDLFVVNLYDNPTSIPEHVQTVRNMMRAAGRERPVVVGEYNGPTLFELPALTGVVEQTMTAAFGNGEPGDLGTGDLAATASLETPERRAMKALYAAMPELPAPLQMFMAGCAPELEARRDRINCREIVSRNLFALSVGVRRTVCWQLAPEVPRFEDPFTMMELMHGKLLLLSYDDDDHLGQRRPAADTFSQLAAQLQGAAAVARVDRADHPDLLAFTVERNQRPPLVVLWNDGDVFSGEEQELTVVEWPWPHEAAFAVDAFGTPQAVELRGGQLSVAVTVTPTFVSSELGGGSVSP